VSRDVLTGFICDDCDWTSEDKHETVTALIECGVCVPSNYTGFYIKCNLLRNKEK